MDSKHSHNLSNEGETMRRRVRGSRMHFAQSAYFKGMMWLLFSATAMLSAFVLPIHIWMLMDDRPCSPDGCVFVTMRLDEWWFQIYFFILVAAALYHSFYRVKTILWDLKLVRISKVVGVLLALLFAGSLWMFGVTLLG